MKFPQLKSFSICARVASQVRVRVRAETSDAKAADNLSDLVRGMAAIRARQKQSDESLRAMLESLEVDTSGEVIELSFEVDADTVRDYLHLKRGKSSSATRRRPARE